MAQKIDGREMVAILLADPKRLEALRRRLGGVREARAGHLHQRLHGLEAGPRRTGAVRADADFAACVCDGNAAVVHEPVVRP